MSFAGFAQLSVDAVSPATQSPFAPEAILFDQFTTGGSGIVSDYSSLSDEGVYAADDFTLTSSSSISSITVTGFQNLGTLEAVFTGFDLYIYADMSGKPDGDPTQIGTGLFEAVNLDPTDPALTLVVDATSYTFTVDVAAVNGGPVDLAAGTYWVSAFPRLDISPVTDGPSRWNWYQTDTGFGTGAEAHLIDPDDLFGAGATDWTTFTDLGLPFNAVSFLVEGDVLGVNDNIANLVSVYPNPATDVLNVKLASSIDVSEVAMYDVVGKKVGVSYSNGKINISGLAQGVYVLKVNTNAGTLTQKVIKQ